MKRKITSSQPQQDKPDFYVLKRAFIAAFNETGDRYRIAHYNTIENRSKDHKINMRSWNLEKSLVPPIVEETIDGFKVYDMLYLTKPLYRKIELMAQLKEQSFMSCLIWMAEQNVEAVLDNNEEWAR